mmetsp:Transcript_41316/g.124693  ORF Transcript_41316/g.124693 Transcript_41316/m.124693 type:complete len:245 (+) Transcript_41316:2594-3328(+)
MLATMNRLPPSATSGAASSSALSMSALSAFMDSFASCMSIFATKRCSCSAATDLALDNSTFKALSLLINLDTSWLSSWPFFSFLLSFCLSIKNCLAPSNFSCAALSASPNFSHISCAVSADISELPLSFSFSDNSAAESVMRLIASSASATLASACCCSIALRLLSVSFLKFVSFSVDWAPRLAKAFNSLPPLFATASTNLLSSPSLSIKNSRACVMPFCTSAAAASQSATALTASSKGRTSMP